MNALKQIGSEDRGVSPVIGVIMMVAITVILAALIGGLLLGWGDNIIDQPVRAGASVQVDETADRVSVTFTERADSDTELRVTVTDVTAGSDLATNEPISNVGESYQVSGPDGNDVRIVVTAINGDRETVIAEETGTL